MKQLWSCSTTMRNPERAFPFLSTIAEMENREWTKEAQEELQSRLIKNRFYIPTKIDILPQELQDSFNDLNHKLTLEEAKTIFYAQNYKDAPMRGRTSFDPLEKMGLVALINNKISITDMGQRFLDGEIEIGDVMLSYLLKFQYPNPLMKGFDDYNTNPFINTLRLIRYVNEKCRNQNLKEKGISKLEFGIFALSIVDYSEVESISEKLLNFRKQYEILKTEKEKSAYSEKYISEYLADFNNPQKNIKEYTDNIIRCLRLTKYIYIRGGGYYIDLEPRRMYEINAILNDLTGEANFYSIESYQAFIGDYYGYTLPFEKVSVLTKIATDIQIEINELQKSLQKPVSTINLTDNIDELKKQIHNLRNERLALQNETLKFKYEDNTKITEAEEALRNITKLEIKPSIALEKWANVALNIIDDANLIKPNSPLGDDNEPTFTAPAKVPDIECFYDTFSSICEVTMLTGRDQWYNEGQPVMRHLREFEYKHSETPNYCLFIAPRLHDDTINTFWIAVKYEYEGAKQKIIPITITELIEILEVFKTAKSQNIKIPHTKMMEFYNNCTNIENVSNSTEWRNHIANQIILLKNAILIQ
ncbi:MAG: AlwI family type II restriction endonuclease [Christensenellales bacterium]